MLQPDRIYRNRCERVKERYVLRLNAAVASICMLLFSAPGAGAGQRCWPLEQVLNAHDRQGDEILVIFRSWTRDGAYTIIYHDPSDGVVTEVAVYAEKMACVLDAGDRLEEVPQFEAQPLG